MENQSKMDQPQRIAHPGDVVTIDLLLKPENGYVPDRQFDMDGRVTFVLSWGNYLPGIHELAEGCKVGDSITNVSVDAGWGSHQKELIFTVPSYKLSKWAKQQQQEQQEQQQHFRVGDTITLTKEIQCIITHVDDENALITLDANPPLSGASYSCSFTVLDISSRGESPYETATFAMGCFWGAELAMTRIPGVVGTRVGYTQGSTPSPTYEQVCTGTTQHCEAVQVTFDKNRLEYRDLVRLAVKRMRRWSGHDDVHRLFDEQPDTTGSIDYRYDQYRYGIYYHSNQQEIIAREIVSDDKHSMDSFIEMLPASIFYLAEEFHQQYLYKRGQSTRKNAKESIRCYG
jgi:peptide-methionine (S)-S-oxide reductase